MMTLEQLTAEFSGEIKMDRLHQLLYATDASIYEQMPEIVLFPTCGKDVQLAVQFANDQDISITARTAGTSLAGQVVNSGIIMDFSRFMNQIVAYDPSTEMVTVQPGVIRDELNIYLKQYNRYFGPETSTSNRAMMGGMLGNNSCGSNSIVYGSTRNYIDSITAVLSDGSIAEIIPIHNEEEINQISNPTLKDIYQRLIASLNEKQHLIQSEFPGPSIPRRNSGYALDELLNSFFFGNETPLDLNKLISGSEGTLLIATEIKLKTVPLPPKEKSVIVAHFHSIQDSLQANIIATQHAITACELMDRYILEGTENSILYKKHRKHIKGNPGAILAIEIKSNSVNSLQTQVSAIKEDLKAKTNVYDFSELYEQEVNEIWELRKAGLGLLNNMPGDAKPIAFVEDTAVKVDQLPEFIAGFDDILNKHNTHSVYYAHAGTGELHLRPILNLKTEKGIEDLNSIAREVMLLTKKFNGSFSGEHGDGRLRSPYLKEFYGEEIYDLFKEVKSIFDPKNIFNPGKIVTDYQINDDLKINPSTPIHHHKTGFKWRQFTSFQHALEQCTGSGDCRKTDQMNGVMCPSYKVSLKEEDTTRGRSNTLRQVVYDGDYNNFSTKEVDEVLKNCVGCKACKNECPSLVDMAQIKSEVLYQQKNSQKDGLSNQAMAFFTRSQSFARKFSGIYNYAISNPLIGNQIKNGLGIAKERSLPKVHKKGVLKYFDQSNHNHEFNQVKTVVLFVDEFTEFNDYSVGKSTIDLLRKLGYKIQLIPHLESGRTFISKGYLKEAKHCAEQNVLAFYDALKDNHVLVGIEPSAILTFKDEYLDLVEDDLLLKAKSVARKTYTIEEFICAEFESNNITPDQFNLDKLNIKVHVHCHHKAIGQPNSCIDMLNIPTNYSASMIESSCCGMAGSYGYEKDNFEFSKAMANAKLIPAIDTSEKQVIIAANGTSCRHQIADFSSRTALHPIEILNQAILV